MRALCSKANCFNHTTPQNRHSEGAERLKNPLTTERTNRSLLSLRSLGILRTHMRSLKAIALDDGNNGELTQGNDDPYIIYAGLIISNSGMDVT